MEATLAAHLLLLGIVVEYHFHDSRRGCLRVFDVPGASIHDRIPLHHRGLPSQVVVGQLTRVPLCAIGFGPLPTSEQNDETSLSCIFVLDLHYTITKIPGTE